MPISLFGSSSGGNNLYNLYMLSQLFKNPDFISKLQGDLPSEAAGWLSDKPPDFSQFGDASKQNIAKMIDNWYFSFYGKHATPEAIKDTNFISTFTNPGYLAQLQQQGKDPNAELQRQFFAGLQRAGGAESELAKQLQDTQSQQAQAEGLMRLLMSGGQQNYTFAAQQAAANAQLAQQQNAYNTAGDFTARLQQLLGNGLQFGTQGLTNLFAGLGNAGGGNQNLLALMMMLSQYGRR